MHRNTRFEVVLGSVLVLGLAAAAAMAVQPEPVNAEPATSPAEELPSAESVFERHIEQIGGVDAVSSITRRRISGILEEKPSGRIARLKMWQDTPNKLHVQISEALGATTDKVYDGETAWERVGSGVSVTLSADETAQLADTSYFNGEADFRAKYSEFETTNIVDFQGEAAHLVEAVTRNGKTHHLLFSVETGLCMGTRTMIMLGDRPITLEVTLHDYKAVGGVKFPMKQRQVYIGVVKAADGSLEQKVMGSAVIEFTSVEVNTMDTHDYAAPPGTKPRPEPKPVPESDG